MKTILIGGWGYQATLLKPLIDAAPAGIGILPFGLGDLYEVGKSNMKKSPCYFQNGLAQVLQFFNEPITLMGWSTGAMIAFEHAQQNTFIEKLVLIAPSPAFTQNNAVPYGTPKSALLAMKKAARRDALSMLWKFDEKVFHPMENPPYDEHAAHFELRTDVLSAGLDYLMKVNLLEQTLDRPVDIRLIHGAQDQIIPLEAGQAFAEQTGVELKVVSEAGHGLPLTHPENIWQIAMT